MTRKVLLCKYNFYFIGGDWLGMQMDGRLKEVQLSLPRSTDLSLIKGDRRHGEGRHASRVICYQEH